MLLAMTFLVPALVVAAPHPVHNDGGAVNWKLNWNEVVALAKKTGRPILLHGSHEG
jgi:hypothetical protein